MSWWVGLDREEFARRLAVESYRIQRLDLSTTAPDMARHRRTRQQLAKDAQED